MVAFETNYAVCSSMLMHVDLMADCGHKINLLISSKIAPDCFKDCNYEKSYFSSKKDLKNLFKNHYDYLWCTSHVYVNYLKFIVGVKCPILLWQQGDGPSESYMHHHSKFRSFLIRQSLAIAFKMVKGVIFVSNTMADYYRNQYRFNKAYIVVPCLSEFGSFNTSIEKIPNSFVYIGGLSVWQCFDETLQIYKSVRSDDSVLHIITLDINKAKEKVRSIIGDEKNIEIYGITDRSRIPEVLSKFQYGFLIRRDDIVNYVSSPIKFLEYLSCGVNVIMTSAVPEYAKIVEEYHIGTVVDLNSESYIINEFSNKSKEVYNALFDRGYFLNCYKNFLAL